MINKLFQNLFRICPKTGGIVGLKIRQHWAVLFFPMIGLAALIWYLVRVIPKPSRAAYPCQRVAAPLAMGFVASVLGWLGASAAFRSAKKQLMEHRYRLAAACAILGLVLASAGTLSLSSGNAVASGIDNGKNTGTFTPIDGPNQPMGTGKGINPGRVVWVHNADATSWNGSSNYWYSDAYNNQAVISNMLRQAVLSQAGQTDLRTAWNEIFRYNNQQRGRGSVGYTVGEKIAIKVNVNSGGGGSNRLDESPHLVYAMLDQLVNVVGVRQSDIVIYDAMRGNMSAIEDRSRGAFPNVLYNDWGTAVSNAMTYSVGITDSGARQLPSAVVNATYLINMAALKRHLTPSTSYSEGQGQTAVTLTAKNHCGSILNCSALHDAFRDWPQPMGNYNPLVDFMSNPNVGRKTVLYVIDGLYSTSIHNGTPQRWPMAPFNNDWPSSVFISQDPVAIDSVGLDFLRSRWTLAANADNFLHEAAQIGNPPSGVNYLGKALGSMGVHEHWNNATDRQYSRNLGTGQGIELVYIEGSGPIITPTPSLTPTATATLPPGSSIYQAEAASLGGGVTVDSNHTGFNGTGFVNFPLSGGYVQFNNADGGTGGSATLRIRFALGATTARTGLLIVNGASQNITFNPTGAWTTWVTQDVTVSLNSGTTNTLRFESNGQDLANLDQIQVIPSSGPTNTPTATATKTSTPTATRTPTITPTQPPGGNVYQAEAASLGGGVTVDSNHTGFNGTGFVNFPLSGGYVQFNNVNGGTGGSATLRIRYALGITTSRTGLLIVNGASQNITFNPTGAWTTWATQDVTVSLNSGTTNTLRFESNGQDLANLDQIELILSSGPTHTPTPTATQPTGPISVEAESGALSGAAVIASCAACSGGQKVGYLGNGAANYVTLTVNAPSSGNYTLTLYYLLSGTRSFYVGVNGGAGVPLDLSGSSWSTPVSTTMTVSLNAGSNTIRFYNDAAYAPDLDRIVIQ